LTLSNSFGDEGIIEIAINSLIQLDNSLNQMETNTVEERTKIDASFESIETLFLSIENEKQDRITHETDLNVNDLHVKGDFTLDGTFNVKDMIYTTNEIIISTQLDISNQGFGPALKVTQFGAGDNNPVALFHAGGEGPALLIDSGGDVTVFKKIHSER